MPKDPVKTRENVKRFWNLISFLTIALVLKDLLVKTVKWQFRNINRVRKDSVEMGVLVINILTIKSRSANVKRASVVNFVNIKALVRHVLRTKKSAILTRMDTSVLHRFVFSTVHQASLVVCVRVIIVLMEEPVLRLITNQPLIRKDMLCKAVSIVVPV